jgi:hypothetical protein
VAWLAVSPEKAAYECVESDKKIDYYQRMGFKSRSGYA